MGAYLSSTHWIHPRQDYSPLPTSNLAITTPQTAGKILGIRTDGNTSGIGVEF